MGAYFTASDNVLLAEMLGSTTMIASSLGKPSAGSALLCDMTAFEHYVICLNGNGRLTPCLVHHVLYVTRG